MAHFAHDTVVPYQDSAQSKKEQVAEMFDDISPRYDFLNRFLSAGIDKGWRKKAIQQLETLKPQYMLDVACGTGDMAILSWKMLNPQKIIGIDISEGMLSIGRQKISREGINAIELLKGDSEAIIFETNSFDAVTVAFGVRNFQDLQQGLAEIWRVLKPGGKLLVLEFSKPKSLLVKTFYNLYMRVVTPNMGKLFSKNRHAYEYLDASIKKFPEGNEFLAILENTGFKNNYRKSLSLGICSIYCGEK